MTKVVDEFSHACKSTYATQHRTEHTTGIVAHAFLYDDRPLLRVTRIVLFVHHYRMTVRLDNVNVCNYNEYIMFVDWRCTLPINMC